MQTNKQSEYRSIKFEARVEEKAGESGKKLVLRGYPIVFNTETTIYDGWYGEIRETILPNALEGTDLTNVYLLSGHNIEPDKVLGRNNVNMKVEVDDTGLYFECTLPNTQEARDIYNLVESGIIDGMSFGFRCSDEVNPETMLRTITHIDELYEVSITPFPAYKEASVIARDEKAKQEADQAKADAEKQEQAKAAAEAEQKKVDQEMKELEDLANE